MLRGVYSCSGRLTAEHPIVRRLQGFAEEHGFAPDGPMAVGLAEPALRGSVEGVHCALYGHLHDRIELARELDLEAGSDAELIARGYRLRGERLFEQLRGSYAFSLWDRSAQRGLLGCDLLATQQLFLRQGSGCLAFATDLPSLLAILPSQPAPDPVAVSGWLGGWTVPIDRTLYEGVSRLLPGELVELDGDARVRTCWRPQFAGTMSGSREELADGLRLQIEKAVSRRLSSRSSAVILSGGLDSSIVAAAASRVKSADARLTTYSAVFPNSPFDEAWKVRSLTASLGIRPNLFEVEPQGALWLCARHARRWGLPLISPGLVIDAAMVAAARRDGNDVALDGEKGDEVLGLSPWLIADRLMNGRLISALRLAREFPGWGTDSRSLRYILEQWGLRGAAPSWLHDLARRGRSSGSPAPEWLRPELREGAQAPSVWAWKTFRSGPRWWRYQADRLFRDPHRGLHLEYSRNRSAEVGILDGIPLYDFDLVDYSLRLPPELAFDPDLTRPLARTAMRGIIPDDVRLDGQKANFSPFYFEMMTCGDANGVEQMILAPGAEIGAYVDMERVVELWHRKRPSPSSSISAKAAWTGEVWRIVAMEIWLRSQAEPASLDAFLADPHVPRPRFRSAPACGASTFLEPTFYGLAERPSLA